MADPLNLQAIETTLLNASTDDICWRLLAALRAHRAALTDLTLGTGGHLATCGIPRECTCGMDTAREVLASCSDGRSARAESA